MEEWAYTGHQIHTEPQAFWTHPQESGGWSNDFSGRLVPLQPRCINILWGEPGWCMHMNRTLLWYESLPWASCHRVRGMSPSLHISNKTTIPHYTVAVQAHIPSASTYADEQTHQFSLYLVVQVKYRPVQANPQWVCVLPALHHWLCRLCLHSTDISTEVNDERALTGKNMDSTVTALIHVH